MAISFPASPTVGQTYVYNSRTWTWDGSIWHKTSTNSNVTTSMLVNASVTTAKIADLAVTSAKLSSEVSASLGGIKITSIVVTDNSYTNLDDTALDTAGGYIKIIGTGFASGCQVLVNQVPATSTTFISSTEIRAQLPSTIAGTYVVYVANTDGSVGIRINGITFSDTPGWTTSSTLPNGVVSINLSIQLAATSATSYVLTSGSTLPAGLTLSSGGLLSGTVTGLAAETTYSFSITAIDAELQDSRRTFSITITVGEAYFRYTTLLLQANTAPTYISDASSNTFEITPVGAVKSDTSQPFQEGYYSGFFNGTTDYLTLTNNTALGSGSFTIECWVYPTATPATNAWIYGYRNGGDTSPQLWINSSRQPVFGADISTYITSSTALSLSTWSHIAIVRNGTAMVMYINGVSINTATTSQNFSYTGANSIGAANGASIYAWAGYISNLRVVSGVAVYTAAFSPPTAPLTITQSTETLAAPTAVDYLVVAGGGGGGGSAAGGIGAGGGGGYRTGTSFAVASGTALTVTVGTGGAIGAKGLDSVFSSITSTGGGFGGGTGQYTPGSGGSGGGALAISGQSTTLGLGNTPSTSPVQGYNGGAGASDLSTYTNGGGGGGAGGVGLNANSTISSGNGGPGVLSSISGISTYYGGGGGGTGQSGTQGTGGIGGGGGSGTAGTANTGGGGGGGAAGGSGIVIIRHADTLAIATCTGSPTITVSNGYKIYKFTSSGTITFNTETKAAITSTNTSLLTLQSNRFKDQTAANLAITTAGTPAIKTLQPFTLPTTWATYGAGYFGIKTDYLTVPATTSLTTFTGDFTFEAWVYPTDTSITQWGIWDSRQSAATATALMISLSALATPIAGSYRLLYYNGAYNYGTGTGQYNQWAHIAIVRSGSTMTFYINGVAGGTSTISGTQTGTATSNPIYIGNKDNGLASYGNVGYISNLRLVNGTAVYTGNFTPPTSLLTTTQASGANIAAITTGQTSLLTLQYKQGSNNNGFIDSSQNNFPITRVGTPTQGTSSPFSQTGWSGYFDGSTGYFTLASNAAFAIGTIFTVELWIRPTTITNMLTLGSFQMGWASASSWGVANAGVSWDVTSATMPTQSAWNHVAVVRTGTGTNQTAIYLNGVSIAVGTFTPALTTSVIAYIGSGPSGASTLGGYMSNLRIVKGVAVYTGAFTPPTSPLTITQSAGTNISAITGTQTSLLTLQSNYFKDQTAAALPLTTTTTGLSVQSFSPFAPTAVYDAATNGGTAYFNGTTDGLSAPAGAAFNFTGDYTAEAWVNWSSVAVESDVIGNFVSSVASDWMIVKASTSTLQYYPSSAATFVNSGITPTINTWYHIAAVRSGTTCSLYVNGVSVGTPLTFSGTLGDATKVVRVGSRSATNYIPGYLSNVRIVKGTAVYTGTFTPPTAPLTASGATSAAAYPSTLNVNTIFPASNTSLLINGTNGGIIDATSKNSITTVGDARVSTTQKKFGTGSMYFDGTGDYLSLPSSINNALGAVFTLEFWIYPISHGGKDFAQFGAFELGYSSASAWGIAEVAVAWRVTTTTLPTLNTWNHIAIVRTGTGTNQTTIYLNGISVAVGTYDLVLTSAVSAGIGAATAGTSPFNGYIDDFRITKYARYTANFTPPVGGFSAQ
ncbi:Concanavalin A-like lectin/glucanases superfamily [uncultured Caudovirales phage]|uniref:Concanavalin A-like lectin/glucanases superfamily n=1 Tax=uncultured Caudovirales phage TaxID=2100421 RepID=A0A6J5PPG5_9CAUD|nr:Concanavalin A-like lectin/glucanases superfamily [uncultured Caudovirales phage]CAB4185460.1 Concanavalin A-like lectin/glucanases superfamily [uncultured Caudovirales phage]CAB4193407.1 Concanavalin A-like lectin/glucanases superfamily [uncultured Caudovirales phage]CAB4216105.1 Concanavalin A-like lectin/glucanases superfamily [uncultured Caudovirales phage]CAB5230744.1 Concanavalin A-like lectin/glucanases superfamily [uncultured Caudovirales phage]